MKESMIAGRLRTYNILRVALGLSTVRTWKASIAELDARLEAVADILKAARYPKKERRSR